MSKKHKVTLAKVTGRACPTQMELSLDDGKMAYIRYRYGMLSIRVSTYDTDDVMDAVKGNPVIEGIDYPRDMDKFDGVMDITDIIERTSGAFNWSEVKEELLKDEQEHNKRLKEESTNAT